MGRLEQVTRIKQKCIEYLGGCCQRCGYNRCPMALECHHKPGTKKEFEISRALSSSRPSARWEVIKPELDKCILLCSNCHKETHWEQAITQRQQRTPKQRVETVEFEGWPAMEQLVKMVTDSSFKAVGQSLGVTDNAVRKRLKKFGIDPKSIRSIKDNRFL